MTTVKHDIQVALLGNVSTGKTMTMNALFGNKYGEVSMKRTTAAVNYFRISTSPKSNTSVTCGGNSANISPSQKTDGADESKGVTMTTTMTESRHPETDKPRTPESTLKEISEDNQRLRDDTGSTLVHEKWFDIELDEQLCEMRNDTRLVIVDIPGINEAGACSKYKDYVDKKWHTFDCVVLVMDGKQGVNTQDQALLLNLVKRNKERIKNVPVIILFNKVDDPEDQEQAELIREAFQEIEALFSNKKTNIIPSGKRTANSGASDPKPFVPRTKVFGAPSAAASLSAPSPSPPFIFGAPSAAALSAPAPPFSFGAPSAAVVLSAPATPLIFGAPSAVASLSAPSPPLSLSAPSPVSFAAPWAPSTPPLFSPGTQNQFVFGATSSQVDTSPPASSLTKTPSIARTPQHQQKESTDVFTPNEKEDISTKEDKGEPVGNGTRDSIPFLNDGLAKADLTVLHENDPFKNLPPSVAFIPISSLHGFANRCASGMTLESFCNFFDKELIEKVGKEQLGRRQWKQLSEEEQTKAVFDMLSDPDECRDVLHDSRFDKFMTKLNQFVGGDEVQTRLIEEQIKVTLRTLLATKPLQISVKAETGKNIAQHIKEAYTKMQSLKKHVIVSNINILADELTAKFWEAYIVLEKNCVDNIRTFGPDNCHVLSEPLDELEAFHAVAKESGWSEVADNVVGRMQMLVQQMIGLLLEQASKQQYSSWRFKSAKTETDPWKRLSPLDWSTIWSSILLLSYDRQFCLTFGTPKLLMERELVISNASWLTLRSSRCCSGCGGDLPKKDEQTTCGGIVVIFVKCSSCNVVFVQRKYNVPITVTCFSCGCRNARPNGLTCSSCKIEQVSPTWLQHWALLKYDGMSGKTEAKYPAHYTLVSSISMVKSLDDKNHIWHAAYRFCEFVNTLDKQKA